jgi:hypothetical protein
MSESIIDQMHYALITQIDGDQGDRFLQHVGGQLGPAYSLAVQYSEDEQVRWMAGYWLDQLATVPGGVPCEALALLRVHRVVDFMHCFNERVVPLVAEYGLPHLSIRVHHFEDFAHGQQKSG